MIREFTIGCSHTINKGNFESMRVEASLTMVVDEADDLEALKGRAQAELRALLEDTYRAQSKPR